MEKKSLIELLYSEEIALHELGLCKFGEDKLEKNKKILKDVFSRGILSGSRLRGEHYGYDTAGGLQYDSMVMMARASLGYLTGFPTKYDGYFKAVIETKYGRQFFEELKSRTKELQEYLSSEHVSIKSSEDINFVGVIDNPKSYFTGLLGLVNKYFGLNLISSLTPRHILEALNKKQRIYAMHGGIGIFHYIPKDGRTIYHDTIEAKTRDLTKSPFEPGTIDKELYEQALYNPSEVNIIGQIFPQEFVAVLVDEEGKEYIEEIPQNLPIYHNIEGQTEFKLIRNS